MARRLVWLVCGCCLLASSVCAQEKDMQEQIRKLEQQIEELKLLKAKQSVQQRKIDHCRQVVGNNKFCTCIAEKLPAAVSFEQYVHTLVTPKEELGYSGMSPEQKKVTDATLAAREKCIGSGFLW